MSSSASPPPQCCPFCQIALSHPSYTLSGEQAPLIPSQPSCAVTNTLVPPSYVVLSTPLCLAFLDHMPLSEGHLLLITRKHHVKISDVDESEASELGVWLSRLSRVLCRVVGTEDWNLVQNNGAAAAQVVPHMHFHIIPRPALTPEMRNRSFTMFGRGQRSDLDRTEANELTRKLKQEFSREMTRLRKEKL